MPDFNLAPQIGGVDTSDPSRMFSPEEQEEVLDHIFGSSVNNGRLVLPNDEKLYVGRESSDKYSIGREPGDGLERPALFVPKELERGQYLLFKMGMFVKLMDWSLLMDSYPSQ